MSGFSFLLPVKVATVSRSDALSSMVGMRIEREYGAFIERKQSRLIFHLGDHSLLRVKAVFVILINQPVYGIEEIVKRNDACVVGEQDHTWLGRPQFRSNLFVRHGTRPEAFERNNSQLGR